MRVVVYQCRSHLLTAGITVSVVVELAESTLCCSRISVKEGHDTSSRDYFPGKLGFNGRQNT
jgi:hypothetical protein